MSGTNRSLMASTLSRTISAVIRCRIPRDRNRFSGSASRDAAPASEVCLYVAEMTIFLCNALMSQPDSRNSTESQSSSSGWVGASPWEPKSSVVFTIPRPKCIVQIRFTKTREVNGCSGSNNHSVSPIRFPRDVVVPSKHLFQSLSDPPDHAAGYTHPGPGCTSVGVRPCRPSP